VILTIDTANHALLWLLSKLWFGHFVVEQESKQDINALTYQKCMASSVYTAHYTFILHKYGKYEVKRPFLIWWNKKTPAWFWIWTWMKIIRTYICGLFNTSYFFFIGLGSGLGWTKNALHSLESILENNETELGFSQMNFYSFNNVRSDYKQRPLFDRIYFQYRIPSFRSFIVHRKILSILKLGIWHDIINKLHQVY